MNRLENQNSPYLLQHAENPVDWYPWGEEALAKARTEDKPIFLSIGYAACHWCHVMAHESFEDQQIAEIMNTFFVNIKVDREERPDLDGIYMDAVVALTGQGGWPMSVFLTPEGRPFFGGTYFPPSRRYNMPSFREVLLFIAGKWREERDQLVSQAKKITEMIYSRPQATGEYSELPANTIERCAISLAQSYDWTGGGWGKAPKFPQPMSIEFLLRRTVRGDSQALGIGIHALKTMAQGGMYDVIGGGFARYSTDARWLVPHFEKMLYDNAQLSLAYLHAYLLTGDEDFRVICEETFEFVQRELTNPGGGFYSSLDADSEGEEGKYYVWTIEEITDAVHSPADVEFLSDAYGLSPTGNFEGKNILRRTASIEDLAARYRLSTKETADRLRLLNQKLLEQRNKRIPPQTDDKVLTAWNALMAISFSEAGRYLETDTYINIAIRNIEFLLSKLKTGQGRLMRSWRAEKAAHYAYLEDYAALILACISLYHSDSNTRWFREAVQLADEMIALFKDPEGPGFFDIGSDHETLIIRPKSEQDNAVPSGNSLAALALLQLSALTGVSKWREMAEMMWSMVANAVQRYPLAFSMWLCGMDYAAGPSFEVAILRPPGEDDKVFANAIWEKYRPNIVLARSTYPPDRDAPLLLQQRPLQNDKTTVYVCQQFFCQQPVNSVEKLLEQLGS